MSCGCQDNRQAMHIGICDVCVLVKGDRSLKPVHFCHVCKAWICSTCETDWVARAKAAFLAHVLGMVSANAG
jgi:hypothetical protein